MQCHAGVPLQHSDALLLKRANVNDDPLLDLTFADSSEIFKNHKITPSTQKTTKPKKQHPATTMDLPNRFNRTTVLRMQASRAKVADLEAGDKPLFSVEKQHALNELKVQVQRLVTAENNKRKLALLEKQCKIKENQDSIRNCYAEQLKALKRRIYASPTLLERQKALMAKQTLERRFKDLLRQAGLNEDVIESYAENRLDVQCPSESPSGEARSSLKCKNSLPSWKSSSILTVNAQRSVGNDYSHSLESSSEDDYSSGHSQTVRSD